MGSYNQEKGIDTEASPGARKHSMTYFKVRYDAQRMIQETHE